MADTTTRAEERCERTELLISSCAHCKPNPEGEWLATMLNAAKPADGVTVVDEMPLGETVPGPAFRAHYSSGRCTTCGEHVVRGEMIQHSGDGRYAHVDCP